MHIGYMTAIYWENSETCDYVHVEEQSPNSDPCRRSYSVSSSCSMASCHAGVGSSSGCTTLHSGLPQGLPSISWKEQNFFDNFDTN